MSEKALKNLIIIYMALVVIFFAVSLAWGGLVIPTNRHFFYKPGWTALELLQAGSNSWQC